jgi:hypothetical protein
LATKATAVIQCAEALVALIDCLPLNGTKCNELREKVQTLLKRVRPLADLGGDAMESSHFAPALDKLKSLHSSIDEFVRFMSRLSPDRVEDESDVINATLMWEIDSSLVDIEAYKTSEDTLDTAGHADFYAVRRQLPSGSTDGAKEAAAATFLKLVVEPRT